MQVLSFLLFKLKSPQAFEPFNLYTGNLTLPGVANLIKGNVQEFLAYDFLNVSHEILLQFKKWK